MSAQNDVESERMFSLEKYSEFLIYILKPPRGMNNNAWKVAFSVWSF